MMFLTALAMTDQMIVRRHVARIVPNVREFVNKVHVDAGAVAIYTGFAKRFQAISKIVLRMKGWLHYLPV